MTYAGKYLGTLSAHWPNKGSEYMAERQLYWQVRALMGMVLPHDYGKRIYEVGSVLYELETVSGLDDKNYIRRVED